MVQSPKVNLSAGVGVVMALLREDFVVGNNL